VYERIKRMFGWGSPPAPRPAPAPEGGFEALVVAQLEAIAKGDLRHGSLAGPPLSLEPLPYAW